MGKKLLWGIATLLLLALAGIGFLNFKLEQLLNDPPPSIARLSYDDYSVSLLRGDLRITNARFATYDSLILDGFRGTLSGELDLLELTGLEYIRLLRTGDLQLDRLTLTEADLVFQAHERVPRNQRNESKRAFSVNDLELNGANVDFRLPEGGRSKFRATEVFFNLTGIVRTATGEFTYQEPRISADTFLFQLDTMSNYLAFGKVGFDGYQLGVRDFGINRSRLPLAFDDPDKPPLSALVPQLDIYGFRYADLLRSGDILGDSIVIRRPQVNFLLAEDDGEAPPEITSNRDTTASDLLPHEQLLAYRHRFNIPVGRVESGTLDVYFATENPTELNFDSLDFDLRNLTNIPELLRRDPTAELLVRGRIAENPFRTEIVVFPAEQPARFEFDADLDDTSLRTLTERLTPESPVVVRGGEIALLRVAGESREGIITGNLTIDFDDVDLDLLNERRRRVMDLTARGVTVRSNIRYRDATIQRLGGDIDLRGVKFRSAGRVRVAGRRGKINGGFADLKLRGVRGWDILTKNEIQLDTVWLRDARLDMVDNGSADPKENEAESEGPPPSIDIRYNRLQNLSLAYRHQRSGGRASLDSLDLTLPHLSVEPGADPSYGGPRFRTGAIRARSDGNSPELVVRSLNYVDSLMRVGRIAYGDRPEDPFQLTVDETEFVRPNLTAMVFDRKLRIDSVTLFHPEVNLSAANTSSGSSPDGSSDSQPDFQLPHEFLQIDKPGFDIGNIRLVEGRITYRPRRPAPQYPDGLVAESVNLNIRRLSNLTEDGETDLDLRGKILGLNFGGEVRFRAGPRPDAIQFTVNLEETDLQRVNRYLPSGSRLLFQDGVLRRMQVRGISSADSLTARAELTLDEPDVHLAKRNGRDTLMDFRANQISSEFQLAFDRNGLVRFTGDASVYEGVLGRNTRNLKGFWHFLDLRGIDVRRVLQEGDLHLREFHLADGEIDIFEQSKTPDQKREGKQNPTGIYVDRIRLEDFRFVHHRPDESEPALVLNEVQLTVPSFKKDSTGIGFGQVRGGIGPMEYYPQSGYNFLTVARTRFVGGDISMDDFVVDRNIHPLRLPKIVDERAKLFTANIPHLELNGFQYDTWIRTGVLTADRFWMQRPRFSLFLAQRFEKDTTAVIEDFHTALYTLDQRINLREVETEDARFDLHLDNQPLAVTGRLRFDRVKAEITNLTNERDLLRAQPDIRANVEGRFMESADLWARMTFSPQLDGSPFHVATQLGEMPLDSLNRLMPYVSNFRVKRGRILSLNMDVTEMDGQMHGKVSALYDDLRVQMLHPTKRTPRPVINFFIDLVGLRDRRFVGQKESIVEVSWTADEYRGFFGNYWHFLADGLIENSVTNLFDKMVKKRVHTVR